MIHYSPHPIRATIGMNDHYLNLLRYKGSAFVEFANNILMWFYQQPLSRNLCAIVLCELAVEKHLRQLHFAQADVLQRQFST